MLRLSAIRPIDIYQRWRPPAQPPWGRKKRAAGLPQRLEFWEETSKKAGKGSEDWPLLHCNIYRRICCGARQKSAGKPRNPAKLPDFPQWWLQYRYDHLMAGIVEFLAWGMQECPCPMAPGRV